MSTPLRIRERPERISAREVAPGDMWRVSNLDNEGRESWYVCLAHSPLPLPHCVLWHTAQRDSNEGRLWDVTGEPPNITVTPSINAEPYWHGHITNGELVP